uniref:Ig-like domain-containing protein n=1 Tax=Vespula pensylvanica TaxID=30213 RepID=A0A834NSP9_VESPE|nr:hypothetical protein H0235_011724 [Vespula pensylvanica]
MTYRLTSVSNQDFSEAENGGAIGLDINHPGGRNTEEDHRHFPEEVKEEEVWPVENIDVNSTIDLFYPKKKRKSDVTTSSATTMTPTIERSNRNNNTEKRTIRKEVNRIEFLDYEETESSRYQRDQSKKVDQGISRIQDDPKDDSTVTIVPPRSHQRIPIDVTTSRDFSVLAGSTSLFESRLENSVTVKATYLELRHENELDQDIDHGHFESSSLRSIDNSPSQYLRSTESIERKDFNDIRAISFQVPKPEMFEELNVDEKERDRSIESLVKSVRNSNHDIDPTKVEDPLKMIPETRKDHRSRLMNELLIPVNEKSTKAFYEIKPSVKTELERNNDGGKFILPSVDSAIGKFGPYFVDGDREINVTARIGSTVGLDCKIGLLGDKKVTWVQQDKDSFRLLTVGRIPYSVDQRISLHYRYPSNWRLQILYASPRDSGLYKCQVSTHPPLVKKINVIVTGNIRGRDGNFNVLVEERSLVLTPVMEKLP